MTILCSPSNLKELALGYLLSGRVVRKSGEIKEMSLEGTVCKVKLKPEIDLEQRLRFSKSFSRVILSACGSRLPHQLSGRLSKVKSRLVVKAETILDCVNRLNSMAGTFKRTGGVHAAAIFKQDSNVVAFAEDVGRHNAVDKVVGMAVMSNIDLGECFLTLTGRLTADIVVKAARADLPVVASIAAALDSGIAIARQANLTLVGFVRGKRMTIYTCPGRISF